MSANESAAEAHLSDPKGKGKAVEDPEKTDQSMTEADTSTDEEGDAVCFLVSSLELIQLTNLQHEHQGTCPSIPPNQLRHEALKGELKTNQQSGEEDEEDEMKEMDPSQILPSRTRRKVIDFVEADKNTPKEGDEDDEEGDEDFNEAEEEDEEMGDA